MSEVEEVVDKISTLEVEQLSSDVSLENLVTFFDGAVQRFEDRDFMAVVIAELEPLGYESAVMQKRVGEVRTKLDQVFVEIWKSMGIDDNAGSKAVSDAGEMLSKLEDEEKVTFEALIDKYSEAESIFLGEVVLGKEEFQKRLALRTKFEKIQEDMMNQLQTASDEERQKFMINFQKESSAFQTKLRDMGDAAADYMENLSDEEEETMMRIQAFQSLVGGGGGHGHSHGGEPCHGHGEQESHGHSHAAPETMDRESNHGHSHGGKPCHGH